MRLGVEGGGEPEAVGSVFKAAAMAEPHCSHSAVALGHWHWQVTSQVALGHWHSASKVGPSFLFRIQHAK
jgi:hypothetical protein